MAVSVGGSGVVPGGFGVRCIFPGGMFSVLFVFLNKAFITAWPAQASSAPSSVDRVG